MEDITKLMKGFVKYSGLELLSKKMKDWFYLTADQDAAILFRRESTQEDFESVARLYSRELLPLPLNKIETRRRCAFMIVHYKELLRRYSNNS